MAYRATLNGNQQITIINQGNQTQIVLSSSSLGQQQSQSSSLTTGIWNAPPQLFSTSQGFVLQINGDRKQYFFLIQANGIRAIADTFALQDANSIRLEPIAEPPSQTFKDFEPMQPMQPMRMGNMSMDINSMSMQMGNMSLDMGKQIKNNTPQVFCSQCGTQAKENARFCHSCGYDLSQ